MELDQIDRLIAARKKIGSGATARQLREAAGFTQADLAAELGITASAVSRMESGLRMPRPATLIRWADALQRMEERLQSSIGSVA
ncbi:helix-turn-helix transcriptional regulator [Actinoplanes sp. NPDC023936]|uniref:helix-turn-helix domain-containing protein n=1 Tax=Actinoplanes sp. NPDC023936 TaxID=3154910 RepID=UPI0033FFA02D